MPTSPPYVIALLVAGLFAAGLAVVGVRRRSVVGGRAFVGMTVAVAVWAIGDAAQLSAGTLDAYHGWTVVSFVAAVVTANAGLVFVLQYTGNDHWVTPGSLAALAVEPAALSVLAATTRGHGLAWEYTGALSPEPVSLVPAENGVAFQLHLAYTYVLMAVLLWLLVRFYLRSRGTYRWQTLLLLVGASVPIVTNVLWLVVQQRYPASIDPTPLTFTITGSLFAAALYSFDFLELAPVGRHTVVEELEDAVLTVNEEGLVVDSNPAARRLLAPEGGPLIGEPVADVVPRYGELRGDDGGIDDAALEVAGERRYFDVRRSSLSDAAGGAVGHVVLFRDVTDRRRVEQRYRALIENGTDLINVLGADASVRYASPSVRSLLGYDPGEIEGTYAFTYVHPEDRRAVEDRFRSLVEDPDGSVRTDYRMLTASGEYRVFESRARNLLDDPTVEGVVVNSRDVTERRQREERLQQRNEQLEEFASVISHDLRTPLSVAHGYARLVAEEYDDERLAKVGEAHERMEELLEDLLTLAKEGRAVREPEPVSLEEAAHQAWGIVDTDGARLEVIDDESVLADESRLRQLLENLFANAVDHGARGDGASGGGGVTVRVGCVDRGFYVADDGRGVPAGDRERIFEAGESGDDNGTGLGLTIVKRIADAHGWTVRARDSESGGARFEFGTVAMAD